MIVAGFGFRRGASAETLRAALRLAQEGWPPVRVLAAPLDKLPALAELADTLGLSLVGITPEALAAAPTHSQSLPSLAARQTGSVAEASALAGAGPNAVLLTARHISPDRMATCAIAKGTAT